MKVGVYYNNSDVRVEKRWMPIIDDDEFLLKVIASGICGSDVMEWYRIKKAPIILGHEVTGDIVSIGKNVKKYSLGDRVFVSHHVPCNTCEYCLSGNETTCDTLRKTNFDPGGFAEYIRIPKINVDRGTFKLPESMSYEEGTFIEPLGCVVRCLRKANFNPGNDVLVLGSGISGLLNIQLSKALGAAKIFATDVNDYRIDAAKKFGADYVFNANEDITTKIKEFNNGKLVDKVIICTGAKSAIEQAFNCADRGSYIVFYAPPKPEDITNVNFNKLWKDEVTLVTTYGASPKDMHQSMELINSKRINVSDMVTHRLNLEEIALGFKLTAEAKESIKVIIQPHFPYKLDELQVF